MKASFHTDESMIVDYLDNNLSQEERAGFEEHLEQCTRCRANVGQQRAWLAKLEAAQMTDDPQAIADPSTLNRIRESLLTDMTAVNQNPISKVQFSRRLSWTRVSGIAAAVVVLAVLVPLLATHWNQGDRAAQQAIDVLDYQQNGEQADHVTSAEIMTVDSGSDTTGEQAVWRVYEGVLADLPALQIFFEETVDESLTEETKAAEPDTGESESVETSRDYFSNRTAKLNRTGQSLLNVLQKAESVQIAVKNSSEQPVMILASYPMDIAGQTKQELEEILQTCQNPVSIEIIRYADLQIKLSAYESGLEKRLIPQSIDARHNWILLLIGA